MDFLANLSLGFSIAFTPFNLVMAAAGVTLGTLIGALPGVGPVSGVALLLPLTFGMDPVSGIIMLAALYAGSMYGGTITSVLINTPGESASVVTCIDGYQMALKGRAGPALGVAAIGSFVAGTVGTIGLTVLAPVFVQIGLKFGPAEYFALVVLAFTTITAILGSAVARGILSLFFGLALGLIGIDTLSGQSRFTFGIPQLLDGIDVVTVAVGLFAVGETFWVASRMRHDPDQIIPVKGTVWMTRQEWARSWKPWLRGTAIGFPIGSLPAGGAEIPTFLSYALEKRLSKHPEEFGHGAIEGVAGPEAANNATAAGVLAPLLTLGLPTSATAAILLAAFQRYGLNPGPTLFRSDPDLVWGLIASLYIGNVMLLILNLPLAGVWVRLLAIPRPLLYAAILVFAGLGTYALSGSTVDLVALYLLGALGFVMRRFDIPVAPAVVGVILGPVAEDHFRRALQIAQGNYTTFVTRPISATILALAALALVAPPVIRWWQARRQSLAVASPPSATTP
jgi:putative tricarboxylic transport membrane protein